MYYLFSYQKYTKNWYFYHHEIETHSEIYINNIISSLIFHGVMAFSYETLS